MQDPLKASDKPLTECGPYQLDEEDAMVYRRPYLTSGASGFALTAISQALKSELQVGIYALLCMWSKQLVTSFHMRFFVLIGRKLSIDFSVAN
jgi:hypothetical protein